MSETMENEAREQALALELMVDRLADPEDMTDEEQEELREELEQRPLCADLKVTIDVTLYTGGPAGGVEFDCERGRYGWEPIRARVWHCDWFEQRGYDPLSDEYMMALWEIWGLEYSDALMAVSS